MNEHRNALDHTRSSTANAVTAAGSQVVVGIDLHSWFSYPMSNIWKPSQGREWRDTYHIPQRAKLHVWVPREEIMMACYSSSAPPGSTHHGQRWWALSLHDQLASAPKTLQSQRSPWDSRWSPHLTPWLSYLQLRMPQHILGLGGRCQRRKKGVSFSLCIAVHLNSNVFVQRLKESYLIFKPHKMQRTINKYHRIIKIIHSTKLFWKKLVWITSSLKLRKHCGFKYSILSAKQIGPGQMSKSKKWDR